MSNSTFSLVLVTVSMAIRIKKKKPDLKNLWNEHLCYRKSSHSNKKQGNQNFHLLVKLPYFFFFFSLEEYAVAYVRMAGLHLWVEMDRSQAITAFPPILIFFFPKQNKTALMDYCGQFFSRHYEWIPGSNGGNEKKAAWAFCFFGGIREYPASSWRQQHQRVSAETFERN